MGCVAHESGTSRTRPTSVGILSIVILSIVIVSIVILRELQATEGPRAYERLSVRPRSFGRQGSLRMTNRGVYSGGVLAGRIRVKRHTRRRTALAGGGVTGAGRRWTCGTQPADPLYVL